MVGQAPPYREIHKKFAPLARREGLEDGDGIQDFFGVEVVAVVGVDVHGVGVGLCAVGGFDGQVLGLRIKVHAFDLPARAVFEDDAVAFCRVVVGDGARACQCRVLPPSSR